MARSSIIGGVLDFSSALGELVCTASLFLIARTYAEPCSHVCFVTVVVRRWVVLLGTSQHFLETQSTLGCCRFVTHEVRSVEGYNEAATSWDGA